ncbi:MAG TPA: PsiF family protein [Dyella sp.]|uniref:PsiF family protein n=1 Tax=Dyella sp. TaxID=1869338 RepID=UPI002F93F666
MSKRLSLIVAGAALVFAVSAVHAADTKSLTPQQQKMSDCAKQNKGKKGDDYKNGVKACLSGTPAAAPAKQTQQEKMKSCNVDAKAKSLSGDARKKFMSDCLKGSP